MIDDGLHPATEYQNPMPDWAGAWHLWSILIPRRAIDGALVVGKVWRRHDGRSWIYKKFSEYQSDE